MRRPRPAFSELSVTEFLTLSRVGYFPHGLVIGSCIFEAGNQYDWTVATAEVTTLSHSLRQARHLAITRMRDQAVQLGAEGVVDVRVQVEHDVWRGARQVAKFVALGTAIGFDPSHLPKQQPVPSLHLADGTPFTSDLTGPDFVTLLRAGYRPVTLAMGACVYGLDPRHLRAYRTRDAEVSEYTQAFFDARETALDRLQQDLFRAHPNGTPDAPVGIVGVSVSESLYGGGKSAPIVEFTAIGTAVAELDPNDPRRGPAHARPQLVMSLDR
ncbi:MAG TPA: heavy metal-binding domain-containing protein [Polyangiaceae bacterium]